MMKYSQLFRILKKEGWIIVRQKGSHFIMEHHEKKRKMTIPFHAGKEVKKGLLQAIMKQADIKTDK